jgi:hypothetical protein
MAEEQRPGPGDQQRDQHGDQPSLELPSLRSVFGRRQRSRPRPAPAPLVTTPPPLSSEPPSVEDPEPPAEPRRRRERASFHVRVPGTVAAALTGAVVGLALVGLTSVALHLCTSWRGTSSCGRPGILLLLAITVVVAVLGAMLLRLLGVATAWSTSLLGIGLLVVLVLLALAAVGDRGPAVVAVPLLSVLTHLAARWLTTTYDEPGERPR